MAASLKVSDNVAKIFHENFNTIVRHEIVAGGRASTKTSRNALKIAMRMLENHNEEWIVVRQHYAHHADSTFLELQTAFERLGLKEGAHFFTRGTKLKITLFNGSTIRFGGMDDFRKLKGFTKTSEEKYIGGIWFFEIDEFKGSYGISQTVATFVRGDKPHFTALYEFNPPETGSWVYDWVNEMKQRDDTLYIFANYSDLTPWEQKNWLGQLMLDEIEETKRVNFSLFENIYLGRPRVLDGACYPRPIPDFVEDIKNVRLDYINVGIDYGDADATTAVALGISNGKFYVLDQYYSKDRNKLITEKEEEIRNWLNWLREEYNASIDAYCETNPQSLYILLKQDINILDGIYIRKVDKKKDFIKSTSAIQERIDAINILVGKGIIFINPALHQVKQAMLEAQYDKHGKRQDDGTSDIDTLDALEYSVKAEIRYILNNYYKE